MLNDFLIPEPSMYVIAYLDTLGYGKAISENEMMFRIKYICALFAFNRNLSTINKMRLYDMLSTGKTPRSETDIQYRIFSDNFLLFTKLTSESNKKFAYAYMIDSCLNLQCHFARFGLKLRGAITVGNLSVNKDVVFGTGLLNAVKLEEKKAIYPRIIIENCIHNEFSDNNILDIATDEDGEYFLDYLSYYANRLDKTTNCQRDDTTLEDIDKRILEKVKELYEQCKMEEFRELHDKMHETMHKWNEISSSVNQEGKLSRFLECHRKMILETPDSSESIIAKKKWLADYHNGFCRKYLFEELHLD